MTLIELIMIIAIGSVLVVGIVKFSQQQIVNSSRMRDYLIALNLAQLEMAKMNNTDYAALTASTSTTLADEASFPGFDIQRAVGAETLGAPNGVKIKQVDIIIDYVGGSFANPIVKLTTYREDSVTFGDGV